MAKALEIISPNEIYSDLIFKDPVSPHTIEYKMINLELKAINLYDCAFEDFVPEIKDNFCVGIDLDIGTDDSDAADIFSVRICSPKWILHNCFQNQRVKWGVGMMIMNEFNHSVIKSEIEKILKECSKETWEKSLTYLLRFFSWEFEDYQC